MFIFLIFSDERRDMLHILYPRSRLLFSLLASAFFSQLLLNTQLKKTYKLNFLIQLHHFIY